MISPTPTSISLPINMLLFLSASLGTYLLIEWSHSGGLDGLMGSMYNFPVRDQDSRLALYFTTAYYTVLIMGATVVATWILDLNLEAGKESALLFGLRKAVRHNLYDGLIFGGLFFHCALQPNLFTEKQLILVGFWFVLSRALLIKGFILTSLLGVNMKLYGILMTSALYGLMLAQKAGYEPFRLF